MTNIAVIPGRFNPPTIGHYTLFMKVKMYIKKHPELKIDPVPVIMVVEGVKSSEDKSRNPLDADTRISIMKSSGKAQGVKFVITNNVHNGMTELVEAGNKIVLLGVGNDRAEGYQKMMTDFGECEILSLARSEGSEKILDTIDEKVPAHLVSGSLARKAALNGNKKAFTILTGLSDKTAEIVMNKIRKQNEVV